MSEAKIQGLVVIRVDSYEGSIEDLLSAINRVWPTGKLVLLEQKVDPGPIPPPSCREQVQPVPLKGKRVKKDLYPSYKEDKEELKKLKKKKWYMDKTGKSTVKIEKQINELQIKVSPSQLNPRTGKIIDDFE